MGAATTTTTTIRTLCRQCGARVAQHRRGITTAAAGLHLRRRGRGRDGQKTTILSSLRPVSTTQTTTTAAAAVASTAGSTDQHKHDGGMVAVLLATGLVMMSTAAAGLCIVEKDHRDDDPSHSSISPAQHQHHSSNNNSNTTTTKPLLHYYYQQLLQRTPLLLPTATPTTFETTMTTTPVAKVQCEAATAAAQQQPGRHATRNPTRRRRASSSIHSSPPPPPTRPFTQPEMMQQPKNVMLHRMRSLRARGLNEKYKVDWKTKLGEGAYGSVHPARLSSTGEKVALKKISRRYTTSSAFKTETDALLRIYDNGGHPNISGLRDMYEDHNYFYLILDLVKGGEMFEHLINFGAYSESDAARLMYEVSSALAFLHGVGVCHSDLKPENLLLSTNNRHDGTIKLIDFGCSVILPERSSSSSGSSSRLDFGSSGGSGHDDGEDEDSRNTTDQANHQSPTAESTGTTAYWPPERFQSGTSQAAPPMDMWAVGVILYIMLTGVHPFDLEGGASDDEIADAIKADPRPPTDPDLVGHLSPSAIELIKKLMEPDPAKRLSAYEMLHHPWVRGETATKEKILDSDKKLSRFQDLRYKLEAGVFAVLVSQGHSNARMSEAKIQPKMSEREDSSVHIMKRAFDVFDAEGKGFVNVDDLKRVASEHVAAGSEISSNDTQEFLATQSGEGLDTASSLSLSQFNKLFKGLQQKHYPRGHYIFHAGDSGDAMYFLSSGRVEIQTRKKNQLVHILRGGDFFGEGSLVEDDNRRFTSAKCATPVDVIEIKREDFDRYVGFSDAAKTDLKTKWRARQLTYAKNLLRLQKNVRVRTYEKGDVVYKEGDIGTSMFRVADADGGNFGVSHGGNVVHKYEGGDSFGESSLLFKRPRSSTVRCMSDVCRLHEMKGEDFLAVIASSPEMASSLRDMCRKRLFKKAVKDFSLEKTGGYSDEALVAAFHEADIDHSGTLNLDEVRRLMHRMDPKFPMEEIRLLLKFVDVDEDGSVGLEEFKRLFRQFEEEKAET